MRTIVRGWYSRRSIQQMTDFCGVTPMYRLNGTLIFQRNCTQCKQTIQISAFIDQHLFQYRCPIPSFLFQVASHHSITTHSHTPTILICIERSLIISPGTQHAYIQSTITSLQPPPFLRSVPHTAVNNHTDCAHTLLTYTILI